MKPVDANSILPGAPGSDNLASETPQKPDRSLRTLVMTWAENTGMHGLPNITRHHNPAKKTFWALLLLAGLTIMIWQIVGIVDKYYSHPIIVQRSVVTLMPRPFPAVTVCNLNPARSKKVAESFTSTTSSNTTSSNSTVGNSTVSNSTAGNSTAGNSTAGNSTTSNSTESSSTVSTSTTVSSSTVSTSTTVSSSNSTADNSTTAAANSTASSPHTRRKRQAGGGGRGPPPPPPSADKFSWMTGNLYNSESSRNLSAMGPNAIPDSLGVTYTFLDYYNSLTGTWKTEVGTKVNDFVIDCSVGTRYCQQQNFSRFLHPLYGNCYTFNALRKDQDLVTVLQPGPLHGLKLTLYVEQTQYVGAVANSAGVNVVIHESNKQPFPEDTGITVSPGQETYIGLKEVSTKRLAYPYGDDCQEDYLTANTENNMYNVVSNYSLPSVNYSKTACMKTCIQRTVEENCNCSSPNLPISDPTVDPLYNSSYTICMYDYNSTTSTISTEAKCAQNAEKDGFTECTTKCKQDCDEYNYIPFLSHSMWPSDAYENDSQLQIMSLNRGIKDTVDRLQHGERKSFMSKNFVKIVVFYNDPLRYMVVSTEGYTILDVLSDMGGQVGLWLGLSVLTIFEIVEMFMDLGFLLCKKTRRPTHPKDARKWTATNAMMKSGVGGGGGEGATPPPGGPMKLPPPASPVSGEAWYEKTTECTEMPTRGKSLRKTAFS